MRPRAPRRGDHRRLRGHPALLLYPLRGDWGREPVYDVLCAASFLVVGFCAYLAYAAVRCIPGCPRFTGGARGAIFAEDGHVAAPWDQHRPLLPLAEGPLRDFVKVGVVDLGDGPEPSGIPGGARGAAEHQPARIVAFTSAP